MLTIKQRIFDFKQTLAPIFVTLLSLVMAPQGDAEQPTSDISSAFNNPQLKFDVNEPDSNQESMVIQFDTNNNGYFDTYDHKIDVPRNLYAAAILAHTKIKNITTANEAELYYRVAFQTINHISPTYFDLIKARADGPKIIKELWQLELTVDATLDKLHREGKLFQDMEQTELVVRAAQNLVRATTLLSEMVLENMNIPIWDDHNLGGMNVQIKENLKTHMPNKIIFEPKDAKKFAGFEGIDGLNILTNAKFGNQYIPKSGDVVLVTGTTDNSAAIGRVAYIDSLYSHQALIYVDENKQIWVLEAVVEDGAHVISYEEFLNEHQGGRLLFLRHPDAKLAANAAQIAHKEITAKKYDYNFSMDLNNLNGFFCSQLVWWAFKQASSGQLDINQLPSHLGKNYRAFLAPIGVTATETYSPGAAELSTDFEIVARWWDPARSRELRWRSLVLYKLFEWLDVYNFQFQSTAFEKFMGRATMWLRTSWLGDDLPIINMAPENMKSESVAVVMSLQGAAQVFLKSIKKMYEARQSASLPDLSPHEIFDLIDSIRLNQRVKFEKWLPKETQ